MHPLSNLPSQPNTPPPLSPEIGDLGQSGKTEKTQKRGFFSKLFGRVKTRSPRHSEPNSRSTKTSSSVPQTTLKKRKVSKKTPKGSPQRVSTYTDRDLKAIHAAAYLGEKIRQGKQFSFKEEVELTQHTFGLELQRLQDTPSTPKAEKSIAHFAKDSKKTQQELIKTGLEIHVLTAYINSVEQSGSPEQRKLLEEKKTEVSRTFEGLTMKHKQLTEKLKNGLENCIEQLKKQGFSEGQIQASLLRQIEDQGTQHQINEANSEFLTMPPILPLLVDTILSPSRTPEGKLKNPVEQTAKLMELLQVVDNPAVVGTNLFEALNALTQTEFDKINQALSKNPPPLKEEINALRTSLQQSSDLYKKAFSDYDNAGRTKTIKGEKAYFRQHAEYAREMGRPPLTFNNLLGTEEKIGLLEKWSQNTAQPHPQLKGDIAQALKRRGLVESSIHYSNGIAYNSGQGNQEKIIKRHGLSLKHF